MPIYEYVCQDCGMHFDALRMMKDADEFIQCADCNGLNTRRCISVFSAVSGGKSVAGPASGCSSCSGGACSSCGRN